MSEAIEEFEPQTIVNQVPVEEEVYCPYGCSKAQLGEFGYCDHLRGFSNDGKTFEPLEKLMDRRTGEDTGKFFVNGKKKQKVLPTDKIVRKRVLDKMTGRYYTTWVSARVYRETKQKTAKGE